MSMRSLATILTLLSVVAVPPTVATAKRVATPTTAEEAPRPIRRPPPPALLVKGPDGKTKPIKLQKVKADVRILGHIAETSLTMTFYNPHNRNLEGDLYVPLPEGSTVSGYALDIKGVLVDGVVVTKEKARQVFEKEVRKGIDPGIVEWTQGNSFKTRIFPLPAKGARTIRLSWVSDLVHTRDGARYQLPMNFRDKVGELALRVEVVKSPAAPLKITGGPKGLGFRAAARDSYIASTSLKNVTVTRDLTVDLPPIRRAPVRVERASDGSTYFAIVDTAINPQSLPKMAPKRIGVYWDASLSRAGRDLKPELNLLKAYLSRLDGPVVVEVVMFRNDARLIGTWKVPGKLDGLIKRIQDAVYDGGTQLGLVGSERGAGKRDLNLLFTDGVSNFGKEAPGKLKAPTWVINASSVANHALLRHIATQTGGAYLNLNRVDQTRALDSIGRAVYQFLGASVEGGKLSGMYPRLKQPVLGTFALAGRMTSPEAKVTLKYGVGTKVMGARSFTIKRVEAAEGDMLRRYWAQKRIDDLLVFPKKNAPELVRVGKRYGIVTPGTSLIVLETFGQYVEHRIRPPKMLADMRKKYDAEVERLDSIAKAAETSKLQRIVKLWESRKKWWNTKFTYPKNYRFRDASKKKDRARGNLDGAPAPARARRPSPRPAMAEDSAAEPEADKKAEAKPNARRPEPGVAMKAWTPDTPYLRAIKAAPKAKRYAEYLKQRKEYGSAPSFFLDTSDYFRSQGDKALALRILSSIAELELENAALIRVLAHRLAQLDLLDYAAGLFERAKELRPEEPQSYRDLALVLARRADGKRGSKKADYAAALELLGRVVMDKWDRFNEIEVIALTELNNIWPKAKKAGVKRHGLDERLIAQLDMDIRIVMSWDADLTDMDLHVVEPSGEEAYYSHNRTRIGGLVSRDFTRGYGPEVYALKKAMKGTYTIKTKYFGSSAAKLAGAVTLQVDVFTNFGRSNEKRRSVTLRLTKKKESFTVAEIEF